MVLYNDLNKTDLPAVHHHHIKTVSWKKLVNKVWNQDDEFDTGWVVLVLYVGMPILACMAVISVILCAIWLCKYRREKYATEVARGGPTGSGFPQTRRSFRQHDSVTYPKGSSIFTEMFLVNITIQVPEPFVACTLNGAHIKFESSIKLFSRHY